MQTFSQALIDLVIAGEVEREVAANASSNRHDFLVELDHALKQHAADTQAAADEAAQESVPGLRLAQGRR
jgi:hypothetical protein